MSADLTQSDLTAVARDIFLHALAACSVPRAMERHLLLENGVLRLSDGAMFTLAGSKRIRVMAMGKAAVPMLDCLLAALSAAGKLDEMDISGVCDAPQLPSAQDPRIQYFAGGHPLPNRQSFEAAEAMLRMARSLGEGDLALFLLSGGASSLMELPLDENISLEDTIAFHRALVHSSAAIAEINCVRKHFSAVKGGRLAAAAGRARKLTLAVSDVPAGHLDALGSGPTLPDFSTASQCQEIIRRHGLMAKFPGSVRAFFERTALPELPSERLVNSDQRDVPVPDPTGAALRTQRENLVVVLSNDDLLAQASERAETLGFHVEIDNACDDWECSDAADYLLGRLRGLRQQHGRVCLLSGGEVTVQVAAHPGIGGRNQQFALECALKLRDQETGVAILSAGSDGIDGSSWAAGAVVNLSTRSRAFAHGLDPEAALRACDAGSLFVRLGDTVVTGPTGNNVRDLRILIAR